MSNARVRVRARARAKPLLLYWSLGLLSCPPELHDGTRRHDRLQNSVAIMNSHQEDSLLLVDRIKQALAAPRSTTTEHARILADISRLQLAVETPLETIYRIGHQVTAASRPPSSHCLHSYITDLAECLRENRPRTGGFRHFGCQGCRLRRRPGAGFFAWRRFRALGSVHSYPSRTANLLIHHLRWQSVL